MTSSRHKGPKGSECPIGEWLEQIGATDIRYVGDRNEPPDFEIAYSGERVAVEVARLPLVAGWKRNVEIAFERDLGKLIKEVAGDPNSPKWHSWCEYDSRDHCPSRPEAETWKQPAREALLTEGPGGEFQLLPQEHLAGRGIVLGLLPAGNQGSFIGVSEDEGYTVETMLVDQVVGWIDKKSSKVRKVNRSNEHCRWWLVFDDEILVAPAGILGEGQESIESGVRRQIDAELWSKVVLVSRFQPERPPPKQPKWFWPLWENPQSPALPDSPC